MFVLRQIAASCVEGALTDLSGATRVINQMADVLPRQILKLADGLFVEDYVTLATPGGSSVLNLPDNYSSASRLFVLLRSDQIIKVVTVMPDVTTSTVLIKPGINQNGLLCFVNRVTSITVTNTATSIATLEYCLFQYPDITKAAAFRDGSLAFGVVTA